MVPPEAAIVKLPLASPLHNGLLLIIEGIVSAVGELMVMGDVLALQPFKSLA